MTAGQFLDIVEIRTKVVGISTFLLGTLYAAYETGRFDLPVFLLTAAAVLCIDMGTTAFNSYYDFVRGTDSGTFNRERDKVLVHRGVSPASALAVALALYAFAGFLGLAIADFSGPFVVAAGICGMAVGYFYTGGPFPISRTPLGELFAGGFLGTVLFLVSYSVQAGRPTAEAVFASVPLFLTIGSILTVNNTCDITGDAASGRKTLSILIGRRAGEMFAYLLNLSGQLSVFVLVASGLYPVEVLPGVAVSIVFALSAFRRMHRNGMTHETKGFSMKTVAAVFSAFTVCLGLGYAAALFLR